MLLSGDRDSANSLVASCILSMVNLEIVITVRFFINMYSHGCLEDFELCWHWANFGELFLLAN